MKVDYVETLEEVEPRVSGLKLSAVLPAGIAAIRAKSANRTVANGLTLLADQFIASATTFLTTIIIGRACLPQELGRYTLGVSLAAILIAIPRSLIWTPYTIFLPKLNGNDRKSYGGSALAHQVIFGVVAAVAISAVGVGEVFLTETSRFGRLLIVFGPAVALILLREHARRNCFARMRARDALAIDVGVSVLQITSLLLLAAGGALTATRAYLVIGSACAVMVAVWAYSNRHELQFLRSRVIADFVNSWRFARWLLVGEFVLGVSVALDPWALSLMHGTSAVALFAVSQSISSLTNPLLQSFHNFFGPLAAHTYADQRIGALYSLVVRTMLMMVGMSAVFVLAVHWWAEDLLVLLFGPEYSGLGDVVTMFALADTTFTITAPVILGLLAIGRSDVVLKTNLLLVVLSLVPGLWFIYTFGPIGVGYSILIAGLGSRLWLCLAFARIAKDE